MRIHFLQHVPFEGPGLFADWAAARGHSIGGTRWYLNETPPRLEAFDWLLVMGGPMGVGDVSRFPWLIEEKKYIERAADRDKTVIGVCLGAQLLAEVLGARVYRNSQPEIGWYPIERVAAPGKDSPFDQIPDGLPVLHWHGDTFDLPRGALHLARSRGCENQLFVHENRRIGLQFHLEIRRSDAEMLVQHCGHELVGGPFVQGREGILAPEAPFEAAHAVLEASLDRLV